MVQRFVILAVSLSLLISPGALLSGRAAARSNAGPADGAWPRAYTTGSGARLVLYEPQVASWADQKRLVLFAAASYAGRDQQTPALGTLRIEAETRISPEDRLVDFSELTIDAASFPTLSSEEVTAVVAEIDASVPREERVIGLDRVLAAVGAGQVTPRNVDGVKADPPVVFMSTKPAVLINLDGDPVWRCVRGTGLRVAVNANRDLFEHAASGRYFVRIGTTWLKSASLDGPWTAAGRLPDGFSRLPDEGAWKDVRTAVAVGSGMGGQAPAVFVSRRPAELIQLRGAPSYASVPGTGLLWVSNTDSDIFRAGKTGSVYYLVSGRWFSAPDFAGPWTFATPELPGDFRKIPLEHPRSRVLASVPGTTQALEAVLLAQAPRTARVSRTQIAAPAAVFQGEPQFQPIEATRVARAINTNRDILRVGPIWQPLYYMCVDGVWFLSMSPAGPWALADSIPAEIYEIPISSPAYRVTGVTVDRADDESVVYAAGPAYTGTLVAWGCAVWGTGWYYPPYVGWGGDAPVYYPRTPSYGSGARYNPWAASYAGAVLTDRAHGIDRGATASELRADVYGGWGSTAVVRGNQWAKTSRSLNRATGATTTRATQGSGGGAIGRRGPDGGPANGADLFAGHDGHVYRNQRGSWQIYSNGGWNPVERVVGTSGRPAAGAQQYLEKGFESGTLDQLNHDLAARREGHRRLFERGSLDALSSSL